MTDPRYQKLADVLTGHSTRLKKGESVLIDAYDIPETFVLTLARSVRARGAEPFILWNSSRLVREFVAGGSDAQFAKVAKVELQRMKLMDAYIAIRGAQNIFENSDVPADRMRAYMKAIRPVLNHRVNKTKWVVLRWPTPSMAQQAQQSTEAFEDFFFRVCTLDYARMVPGMAALKALMEKTDRVQLKGPGTDLRFSIKGIKAITCGGQYNIPDGEVFTAPVRDSVEGEITYNTPTVYQGNSFDNIYLRFSRGRIVEARAGSGDQKALEAILDSDAGARFIGEFAIGFNPHVLHPMRDILFDEKIAGSFHFTPGQAYEEADNGNRSQVHWDLVNIQRPDYGGGEIIFDGKVIRKDGIFLPKALHKLNPEYLLGGKAAKAASSRASASAAKPAKSSASGKAVKAGKPASSKAGGAAKPANKTLPPQKKKAGVSKATLKKDATKSKRLDTKSKAVAAKARQLTSKGARHAERPKKAQVQRGAQYKRGS